MYTIGFEGIALDAYFFFWRVKHGRNHCRHPIRTAAIGVARTNTGIAQASSGTAETMSGVA
jgi:hypothetical protein